VTVCGGAEGAPSDVKLSTTSEVGPEPI
jgi:hypothetical protein